jgi:serine phosphatase RsbU (regulator of sigma subunit)
MSEQRLSLLVAGGGILCLLLQLVVSLTDNPVKRAQIASHEVAYKAVRQRAEKRVTRLSGRLAAALSDGNKNLMQSELDLTVQADPEIVEVGIVDNDMTVLASSDPTRAAKALSGPAEQIVRESFGAGRIARTVESPAEQRVVLAQPLSSPQQGFLAMIYLVVTTAGVEDDLSKVVMAVKPPRVPPWLTIGLGLLGLSAALFMQMGGDRKQQSEVMRLQEAVEQMAMGHFDVRIDPQDVPHHAGIAQHLNTAAEQVQVMDEQRLAASDYAASLEQDLQNAKEVQKMLVPEMKRWSAGPLQLCGSYRPASKGSVSGDWWKYFPLDDKRTLIVLADVVGHGAPAAVIGAMTYGCALQMYQDLSPNLRPEALLTRLNEALIVDTKENRLTFASAGHAFPMVYRPRDGQKPFIPLVATGSPLGSAQDVKFEPNTAAFEPGDVLILYTDGLTEGKNPEGEQFGDKRVRQTVQKNANYNVQEIAEALFTEMIKFVGIDEGVGNVGQDDDITVVVARHSTTQA